ncbi:hypothetical protein [Archangium lansingense]|uniref:Lipoprotein n=1 Tax=Archangium lansingense TaxID=2995310 RepID=A0ABT3ZVS3_9BACT|nr:hypothetical protein [Archangium lansinium]MCY1073518.1 hypothetical protein [Archangium lansinium]
MKNRGVMLVAALGLAMVLSGCKNDCDVSCGTYQECVSSDFNVERCTDTCNVRSEDSDFEAQAKECAGCIQDQETCSETVNRCWDDCLGVVLASRP